MFSEEIFGIMNDADDVLECAGVDPFGMTDVMEGSSNSLDKLDKYDLTNEQDIKKIRSKINKMNNVTIALKVWSKLSKLVVAGGVVFGLSSAGGIASDVVNANMDRGMFDLVTKGPASVDTSVGQENIKTSAIISLVSLVFGKLSKLIADSIAKSNEQELRYISKSLDTTIPDLQKKLASSKGSTKSTIEQQLKTVQSFKNKVDAQLDSIGNDANTKSLNRISSAGYANAAATLVK